MPSPSNFMAPVDSYFQSHRRSQPTTLEIVARYDNVNDPPAPPDDNELVDQFHPHRPTMSHDKEMMCYTATSTLTRSGQKRDSFALDATAAALDFSRIDALQAFVPLEVSSLHFSLFQQTLHTGLLVSQTMPVLIRPRVDVFDAALLFVDMSGAQLHPTSNCGRVVTLSWHMHTRFDFPMIYRGFCLYVMLFLNTTWCL